MSRIVKTKTVYRVAVWWPCKPGSAVGEYGGVKECETLKEAMAAKEHSHKLGYPEVDVWKVTTKRMA